MQDEINENLDADLPLAIKEKLFDTFNYMDKLEVEMVKDDFCAKVYLKDDSLF